jgi:hypothetical protein
MKVFVLRPVFRTAVRECKYYFCLPLQGKFDRETALASFT